MSTETTVAQEIQIATSTKKKPKVNHRYQRDKDREQVKGIFRFHEVPGGSMSFVFKAYKEDEVERYDMVDGEVYSIPLGVARHLNKNLWYPAYEFVKTEDGKGMVNSLSVMTQRVMHKIRRCSFQSLEFVDIEDLIPEKSIIQVENSALSIGR